MTSDLHISFIHELNKISEFAENKSSENKILNSNVFLEKAKNEFYNGNEEMLVFNLLASIIVTKDISSQKIFEENIKRFKLANKYKTKNTLKSIIYFHYGDLLLRFGYNKVSVKLSELASMEFDNPFSHANVFSAYVGLRDGEKIRHWKGKILKHSDCNEKIKHIVYNNMLEYDLFCGNTQSAINHAKQSLINNDFIPTRQALSSIYCYSYKHDHSDILKEGNKLNLNIERSKTRRHNESKIRVGYISCDLKTHPVSLFLMPILENHSSDFTKYIYNHGFEKDDATKEFEIQEGYNDISMLSDCDIIEKIKKDNLDILVDLGNLSKGNKTHLFNYDLAPIQLSHIGLPSSTGMNVFDGKFSCSLLDPARFDSHYSEKLIRLPNCMWAFRNLNTNEKEQAPFIKNGYITFGLINNPAKSNKLTLKSWANIIKATPESKLLIVCYTTRQQKIMLKSMIKNGISEDRIMFSPYMTKNVFYNLLSEIDIILDSFPFNGGTMTCEALSAGVPVVTCIKDEAYTERSSGRMSHTFLNNIGIKDLSGKSIKDYERIAINLANDTKKLTNLHNTIQKDFRKSCIVDGLFHTRNIEKEYISLVEKLK